jgi:hypothetical protein
MDSPPGAVAEDLLHPPTAAKRRRSSSVHDATVVRERSLSRQREIENNEYMARRRCDQERKIKEGLFVEKKPRIRVRGTFCHECGKNRETEGPELRCSTCGHEKCPLCLDPRFSG